MTTTATLTAMPVMPFMACFLSGLSAAEDEVIDEERGDHEDHRPPERGDVGVPGVHAARREGVREGDGVPRARAAAEAGVSAVVRHDGLVSLLPRSGAAVGRVCPV